MLREMLIILRLSKLNITFSKTLSFHLLSLNGKGLNLSFRTLEALLFLKAISSNLLDASQKFFQLLQSQRN